MIALKFLFSFHCLYIARSSGSTVAYIVVMELYPISALSFNAANVQ